MAWGLSCVPQGRQIRRSAAVGPELPPEALGSDSKAADSRPAPFLIHQESNVIVRAFRDYLRRDIGEILIDNPK